MNAAQRFLKKQVEEVKKLIESQGGENITIVTYPKKIYKKVKEAENR